MTGDLTHDAFLCGKLHLWQPKQGYRAATDAVLLAAACPAKAGESVLDLGCGVGAASLCLASRVTGLMQSGLELQEDYAALARQNAAENGVALNVVVGDLTDMPVFAIISVDDAAEQGKRGTPLILNGAQQQAWLTADWKDASKLLQPRIAGRVLCA